jgi:hypothetical protein
MNKLGKGVINISVKAAKRCRNIFRRRKASQPPRPQDSSPAWESGRNNASASLAHHIRAPQPSSNKAGAIQARKEKAARTHDRGKGLASTGLALHSGQDDRTLESNDLEITLISDRIPAVYGVPERTTTEGSGKAPERGDLEIMPRVDLAVDYKREQPTVGESRTREWVGATQLENPQLTNNAAGACAQQEDPDTKRTFNRYEKAKQQMKESLNFARNEWDSFGFPQLDALSEQEGLSALLSEIDNVLVNRGQKGSVVNSTKWSKCKKVIANTFKATSPFAMNLLTIAKDGAQIPVLNPYGLLFGGLMLLITVLL